ncbi:MAG: type II toxin-antitoxin system RelE/ParE family toxin [Methylococcaceae bacterium]|nr:type II toxin-antitoxin system RelE/ParE family toxin [Methylococcaceae bacterium]
MYKIHYKKSAAKALAKLPVKIADQFIDAFERVSLKQDEQLDIKKLQNRDGYRLRIGWYRALYRVIDEVLVIEVVAIGSRGDIYK